MPTAALLGVRALLARASCYARAEPVASCFVVARVFRGFVYASLFVGVSSFLRGPRYLIRPRSSYGARERMAAAPCGLCAVKNELRPSRVLAFASLLLAQVCWLSRSLRFRDGCVRGGGFVTALCTPSYPGRYVAGRSTVNAAVRAYTPD